MTGVVCYAPAQNEQPILVMFAVTLVISEGRARCCIESRKGSSCYITVCVLLNILTYHFFNF